MFRAMFSPIIRSTWLYLQYLVVFTQVAAGWCHGWVETEFQLIHDTSRLHLHVMICNLNILSTPKEKRAQNRIQVGLYLTQRTDNAQRLLSNKTVALLQKVRTMNKYTAYMIVLHYNWTHMGQFRHRIWKHKVSVTSSVADMLCF
jgi:hypothetical protein